MSDAWQPSGESSAAATEPCEDFDDDAVAAFAFAAAAAAAAAFALLVAPNLAVASLEKLLASCARSGEQEKAGGPGKRAVGGEMEHEAEAAIRGAASAGAKTAPLPLPPRDRASAAAEEARARLMTSLVAAATSAASV